MAKLNPKKNEKKKVLSDKMSVFCQHCTIHGVYYFTAARGGVAAWWGGVLLASVALCGFLSNMIWTKFSLDPTVTVVETTHYPTFKIPFPAVVVCETELVYGPNTKNITNLLLLRGFDNTEIDSFYSSLAEVSRPGYAPSQATTKMHALLEDLDYSYISLLKMVTKPCEVMMRQCVWRSRSVDCSTMFRQIYSPNGFCCRFDINYFTENGDKDNNFTSGVDVTESLTLVVDGTKISHDGRTKNGYLFLFVIDQDNRVTYVDSPVTLTPAGYFDVSISLWAIDASEPVKHLPISSRKCFLPSDGLNASFYEGCLTAFIMRKAVLSCHCLPFEFTAKELGLKEYSKCTWYMYICIYRTLEEIKWHMQSIMEESVCYQRCDFVQYAYSLEHISQLRETRELGNGMSKLSFHLQQVACMKYRREVLYTWDQMLANLGGIFGLCLGGSIISIIELIWFLIDFFYTLIFYKSKKKEASIKKVKGWDGKNAKIYPYHN